MNLSFVLLAFIAFVVVVAEKEKDKITTDWMEQRLDHENASDTRTWRQRYMMNNRFYQTGGPAFLHFGGESSIISDNFLQTCL